MQSGGCRVQLKLRSGSQKFNEGYLSDYGLASDQKTLKKG